MKNLHDRIKKWITLYKAIWVFVFYNEIVGKSQIFNAEIYRMYWIAS